MEIVKGRQLELGQKVRVYLNLNKGHSVYSIADVKTGLVVAYASSVTLRDVRFHVSVSGREKVRKTRTKSVHAWLIGFVMGIEDSLPDDLCTKVYYDPYKVDTFVTEGTTCTVTEAQRAHCANRRVWI